MARPTLHKVFIVRLSDKKIAYIRATDISETFNEHFTHFLDAKQLVVHSLRTDHILDITTARYPIADIKARFPDGIIYVESPGIKTATGIPLVPAAVRKLHK